MFFVVESLGSEKIKRYKRYIVVDSIEENQKNFSKEEEMVKKQKMFFLIGKFQKE